MTEREVFEAALGALKVNRLMAGVQVIYDYDLQRLSVETMTLQLEELAQKHRDGVFVTLASWCLTGKIPRGTNQEQKYFASLVLEHVIATDWPRLREIPDKVPPWPMKATLAFLDSTVNFWYAKKWREWARERAAEDFGYQEGFGCGGDPYC